MKILSGKEVAKDLTEKLIGQGNNPCLAFIRLGDNPSDLAYQRGAMKKADKVGVKTVEFALPLDTSQDELISLIEKINKDDSIHGVVMFRPLPKHIDEKAVCNALDPKKDVDGITDGSMVKLFTGKGEGFFPCTAQAAMEILHYYNIPLEGKKVAVVGRSLVIGKPVMMMLIAENATVTCCHSKTSDLASICKASDIIVTATGKMNTITDNHVMGNQVVIDVGINFDEEGNMVGDANCQNAYAITPVPGGVGVVTSTILMKHVIEASKT
ncbi:MAG: bifunctional 5,10-methylenetetrahydrofolate dehydrogenase/5,10-methenyltetrahydrofolate cyclohydrolase [Clostridia bacterium]|nr:bifunctional 5,10-methylenetetrahydrofolate dehydrogenase/5,10-methenyltetrahydrofolate cyclohydrolase [Clostridia bacterium]